MIARYAVEFCSETLECGAGPLLGQYARREKKQDLSVSYFHK
jgi:hypothetical protein